MSFPAFSPPVQADAYSSTTIPDPSGSVTCTGNNPDGSQFNWTIGGSVNWNMGYIDGTNFNVTPGHLTSSPDFPGLMGCGTITWRAGSTMVPNADNFTAGAKWVYIGPYPGLGTKTYTLGTVTGTFKDNIAHTAMTNFDAFAAFYHTSGPQYKGYSNQVGLSTTYEAATPGIW